MITNYKLFENKVNKTDKYIEKIKKFFNYDYITTTVIKDYKKISIWVINKIIELVINKYPEYKKEDFKNPNNKLKTKIVEIWKNNIDKFRDIKDWTLSKNITPEKRKKLIKMSFKDAYNKFEDWHNNLLGGNRAIENKYGKVIMKFPDGFYWIDLEVDNCPAEAEAMGHCGRTNKGELLSLRDKHKIPHITVSYNKEKGIIYQMKGYKNTKPKEIYHPYIVDLLTKSDYEFNGIGTEYNFNKDFNPNTDLNDELKEKLKKLNPKAFDREYSDEDIIDIYKRYIENKIDNLSYEPEYIINYLDDIFYKTNDINDIIDCLDETNDRFLKILINEFGKTPIFEYEYNYDYDFYDDFLELIEKDENYLNNYIITYVNAKKYYNGNKNLSNREKWEIIFKDKNIEDKLLILKDEGIYDNFKEKLYDDNINYIIDKTIKRVYPSGYQKYDYEELIKNIYFYDKTDEEIFKYFDEWFRKNYNTDKNGKYVDFVKDVFELYDISDKLENILSVDEKLKELEENNYYEIFPDDYDL